MKKQALKEILYFLNIVLVVFLQYSIKQNTKNGRRKKDSKMNEKEYVCLLRAGIVRISS